MSMTFDFQTGTVVWLDPKGQVKAVLLGSRTMTVSDFSSEQALAEALLGNHPGNFVTNQTELEYTSDTDHSIVFGAGAVPIDRGSASPSASSSASPSASPSSSRSASPSASS